MLERVGVIKIELDSYTVKQNIHPEEKKLEILGTYIVKLHKNVL